MSPPEPNPAHIRAAAHGWITRCSKKLQGLSDSKEVDLVKLNDAIEEFDTRLTVLADAQSIVELDEKLEADIEAAAEFREKSYMPHIAAIKIIDSEQNELLGTATQADSTSSVGSLEARLPQLQLPHFQEMSNSGPAFENSLKLKGEAKLAVNVLSLTATNYKTACEILGKR